VVKLLVTPVIVLMERALYGARVPLPRFLALVGVCVGVGVACVNDVHINAAGCAAAACWVPIAAVYKVLWSRIAKEEQWSTLPLMRRVLPLSTAVMLCMVCGSPGPAAHCVPSDIAPRSAEWAPRATGLPPLPRKRLALCAHP